MSDWIELKDLQAVAKAQADGWQIQTRSDPDGYDWMQWIGADWDKDDEYRGRPAKRKVVRVREAVLEYGTDRHCILPCTDGYQSSDVFIGWVKGSEWREVEYE